MDNTKQKVTGIGGRVLDTIPVNFVQNCSIFDLLRSDNPVGRLRVVQVADENMIIKGDYVGMAYRVDAEAS